MEKGCWHEIAALVGQIVAHPDFPGWSPGLCAAHGNRPSGMRNRAFCISPTSILQF